MNSNNTHQCPICDAELEFLARYPRYVCNECASKTTDLDGRPLAFSNVGLHGDVEGRYRDSDAIYKHQECFIDGHKCYADAAYMGGIVIETCDFHEQLNGKHYSSKRRFTLEPQAWYAAEFIGEELGNTFLSYSPIKVHALTAHQAGNGLFKLDFYQANYPEQARHKSYELKTIERANAFILAKVSGLSPGRYMLIHELSAGWIERHVGDAFRSSNDASEWANDSGD